MSEVNSLILSVGMPRAGSGWIYNLTQDLVVASGGTDAGEVRGRYRLNPLLTEVNCNIGSLDFYRLIPVLLPLAFENRYVIKLHGRRKPLANVLIKAGLIKPTYIYRDPRDALLSAFEYGQRMREMGKTNAFTPLTSLEKAIEFMEGYVKIGWDWLSSTSTHHLRYEDLLLKYDDTVKAVVDFLGLSIDAATQETIINSYRPEKGNADQEGTHFVKGKIGRHRRLFSEEEKELCKEKFGKFLEENGYDP